MSVEKYISKKEKDFFEEMENTAKVNKENNDDLSEDKNFKSVDSSSNMGNDRKIVNKDVIDDIEKKIKNSKEDKPLKSIEEYFIEKSKNDILRRDLSKSYKEETLPSIDEKEIEDSNEEETEDSKDYDNEEDSDDEDYKETDKEEIEEDKENIKDIYQQEDLTEEKQEGIDKELIDDIDSIDYKKKEISESEKIIKKEDVEKDIKTTIENFTQKKEEEKDLIKPELKFLEDLEDPTVVYLGRKKSVLKQYGKIASAFIGKVSEKQQEGKKVHIDGLNPHVIFLDGARGTGKSYLLGVIAEELARTNPYIGQIVIDPVGVFWSMKFPNRDTKELKILEEWGLLPDGLKNLKVFIPEGIKSQVSKDTYDDTFSMYPSLLTPEDWCLTYGIERFSPSGLLLEKTLEAVKKGYVTGGTKDVPEIKKISAKGNHYTLEEIISCLQNNSDFQSSQKGYKPDSIRALVSRFEAARSWGIFSDSGTPLSKLSRENQLTVLDTSFLDENITALVIGILARRILSARKLLARKEAVKKFGDNDQKAEELLEIEIPPTWMYIDEAHTLIPSGNTQTPATAGIIEYVKQGRRPGCSLVFATQQPSAINTKVLSQVDILISNKLVFNDDISAIQKRMPAIIPKQYKEPNFIKTLPFATALVGDRSEETSRAFILRAAPRRSQHEGRDAETVREIPKKNKSEVLKIATDLIYKKLEDTKEIKVSFAKDILDVINIKYRSDVYFDEVLEKLFLKKVILKEELLFLNSSFLEKDALIENESLQSEAIDEELLAVEEKVETIKPQILKVKTRNTIVERITRVQIEDAINKRIKSIFNILKPKETIQSIILKHRTIYKFTYNLFDENENYKKFICFTDSLTGEFIHFLNGEFKISKGLLLIENLDETDLNLLFLLKKQQTLFSLNQETDIPEDDLKKHIELFKEYKIISVKENNNREIYKLSENFDIPFDGSIKILSSLEDLPLRKQDVEFLEGISFSPLQIQEFLKKLWGNIEFITTEEIFWPIWHVTLKNSKEKESLIRIDAVTGKEM